MGEDSLDVLLKGKPRGNRAKARVPGLKLADILTMPPEQQSLVNWLMRHYEAVPQSIADHLKQDINLIQAHLKTLVDQGFLKTLEKNGRTYYRVKLAPKSGRKMPKDVWQVLDNSTRQANVFISYSRRNKDFVQQLYGALEATSREVWVDWENIPMAVDWWKEIQLGIELADTFLFVLSPDSVASKVCGQEIEAAIQHNKRLVPVVYQDVRPEQVHPELARLNWIFLRPQDDFEKGFKGLLEALDQDLDYVRAHTRLLVRALEWERNGRDNSYLLRGADLERANHYLAQGKDQAPRPTALHHQYVLASADNEAVARDAELERQKQVLNDQQRWLQLVTAVSVLAIALGLSSWWLSRQAQEAQLKADQARVRAEQSRLKALHQSSEALFLSDQRFEALLAATQAGWLFQHLAPKQKTHDSQAQVMSALQQTLFWVQERNRLEGHTGTVWQADFSPDEDKLASVSADGTIRLWDLEGKSLGVLECNSLPLLDLDFAPDGEQIVAVDADGSLYVWSSEGQVETEWKAHAQAARAVEFSPDGELIASASEDTTIKLWDRDGNLIRTLQKNMQGLHTLLWTQDNRVIAGDEQGNIYIWEKSGEQLTSFKAHRATITALDLSPDGKALVSVSRDRQIKFHDLETGNVINTIEDAHQGPIYNVRFTPDGEKIITVGDDKLIHVWQLDETLSETLSETLVGHTGLVAALAVNPTGEMIATSGGDRAVRLWDVKRENLHVLQGHKQPVNAVAISPDSQFIVSGGVDATLRLWNKHGQFLHSLESHTDSINALAFSPDGARLASASSDGTTRIWQELETEEAQSIVLSGHSGTVNGVAFHPNGQLVATAGNDHALRLWQTDGEPLVTRPEAHPDGLLSVAFSPDGQYLASTGWDHRVRVWTVETLATVQPLILEGHLGWVLDAEFSPDGTLLATASYDNTVKLWEISDGSGRLLRTFEGHQDGVLAVTFSPSGQLLISASNDNTIRVWDVKEGFLLTTLLGHTQGVRDIAVDPQAEFAVSASSDSTALIWERQGMDDIGALLRSSCSWLDDYLANNSSVDVETRELCQPQNDLESTPTEIDEAISDAAISTNQDATH